MTTLKKLPGVLSFQRGSLVSDGLFFNQHEGGAISPLYVTRHGIRGTQNINRIESGEGATATSAKRQEISNIQTTDSAKLAPDSTGLLVRFDVRFVDLDQLLFACAPSKEDKPEDIVAMRKHVSTFVEKAKQSPGLEEVATRYARNIANGRFLWRNRTVAHKVKVRVRTDEGKDVTFDALDIPLNRFEDYSDEERRVAETIAAGMRGDRGAHLRIEATVDLGVKGPVEVFPSQNYLEDKPKGFARPLYTVGDRPPGRLDNTVLELGQAALREQKIANALRTFDTWYPRFEERRIPIPIEPNGASLDAQEFFRATPQASGFRLMQRLGDVDPSTPDGMFMIACLIRGGVFSGTDAKA